MNEQEKIEEYQTLQTQIVLVAKLVKDMPLAEHVDAQRHALEVGPYVDPTAWMRNNKALEFDRRLAEALLSFQRQVANIMEEGEG
jgi:hypothetical protein